ncbi:MAG: tRNA (5-methylaminomethyl-2-thiouridine)(34)-methyltransferase MnmD [Chitinophagales bacterium]
MKLLLTGDGSNTLYSEVFDEIYHSRHGAITESQHVFIQSALAHIKADVISILEVGFGTGLNALLTYQYAQQQQQKIDYTGYELYPVAEDLWRIFLPESLTALQAVFHRMHQLSWNEVHQLSEHFTLEKRQESILDLNPENVGQHPFHLIYFDAFAPEKQPEMWSESLFHNLLAILAPGGFLVTYCAKGEVRRKLQQAGFLVERLPGPPGKREMLRGRKP